ncbi:YtzC family protein [Bacillus stratosphericus]|uniref:YtzC family protein n=1 Tax=Bacillus stratosphericus TaxID=293386 RepID=UPI001CF96A65|nr:YtzC family protein [Bacillus stratosphericus]
MATRNSIDEFMKKSTETLEFASEQFDLSSRQEHYNEEEFSKAQLMLEEAVNELDKLMDVANDQQRERLDRTRVQIQTLQNQMILGISYE